MEQIEKHKPTVMQMFLEKASKTDLMRTFNTLTIDRVINDNYPTLGMLNRSCGADKVEKVLTVLVLDLTTAFEGELNKQAQELAVEIATVHRNLCLEDVYLVFRQLKSTPIYGKLTQNKVLAALNKHFEEKINEVDKISYEKHLSTKQPYGERNNKMTEIAKHKEAFKNYYNSKLK